MKSIKQLRRHLIFSVLLSLPILGTSLSMVAQETCSPPSQSEVLDYKIYRREVTCNQPKVGETTVYWYFKDTNSVYRIEKYNSKGEIYSLQTSSKDGKTVTLYSFLYPGPNLILKRLESGGVGKIINGQTLLDRTSGGQSGPVLKKWYYTVPKEQTLSNQSYRFKRPFTEIGYRPYYADVFDSAGLLTERHKLDLNDETDLIYKFNYEGETIVGFDLMSKDRELIERYSANGELNPEKILTSRSHTLTPGKLAIYKSIEREPIAVIDTGFDVSHPDLAYKWNYAPTHEPLDGIDNDRNGVIDDAYGFSEYFNESPTNNIYERMTFIKNNYIHLPFSHGTHVSHIALRDLEAFALVGYSGEFTNLSFLGKIGDDLKRRNIKFVNMSFGFERMKDPNSPNRSRMVAMKDLISKNPQALFFVAAGNTFSDIDESGTAFYPVAFSDENIFSIGAIKASDIVAEKLPTYKIAEFSSTGRISVDIFCPGYKINSANMGGGFIEVSGTSMASPYCLNLALKIRNLYPNLEPSQIKRIMMLTAYIPSLENPLPSVSGGIVFPERAFFAAAQVSSGEDIRNAAKNSILKFPVDSFHATNSDSNLYFQKWETYWNERE